MLPLELKKYIEKFLNSKKIDDYIGIIVYGSYVTQKNNNLSDIDIMIVMKNYKTQDCGSFMIEGTRIEFFIQDIKNLYYLIKKEIENNNPSHLTKFTTCEILVDRTGELTEFIDYAKQIYNTKIKPEFTEKEKFNIFSINNRIEDLYNLLDKDNFYALYFDVLERIRNVYSKINGIIELPLSKIQRLYIDKDYANNYIGNDIHTLPNKEFISMYLECLKIEDKNIMLNKITDLYKYCFSMLNFDPNNFTLKYKKESPFRV